MTTSAESDAEVRKRTVFYFHGYDPRSNRYYKNHFRENIEDYLSERGGRRAIRAERRGRDYVLAVDPPPDDPAVVDTKLVIPDWHAFIKATLVTNRWALARHYHKLVAILFFSGSIWRLWQVWWKLAAVVCFFEILPLLGILLGLVCALVLPGEAGLPVRAAAAIAIAGVWFVGAWLWILGGRFRRFLIWSLCFIGDIAGMSDRLAPNLGDYEALIDRFAAGIAAEIDEGERDDIVVVGHSVGAIVATAVVARLRERYPESLARCRFRLITLGSCWPFLAALQGRGAARQRADVRCILEDGRIEWFEIVAWEDLLGAPGTDKRLDRILYDGPLPCRTMRHVNPVYPTVFEEADYRRKRRDYALMHFQYLNRPPRAGGFDLYRLLLTSWTAIDADANVS